MSYRLFNQAKPNASEYNEDASAYVRFRLEALQKMIQFNAPTARNAAPSMDYVVDVLYALYHLYTTPHGIPQKTFHATLRRQQLMPFYKSPYASKINSVMSPYSFLFMRDAAFVDLPTTQHLELYYAFMKNYLNLASKANFVFTKGSITDYNAFLQDSAYATKYIKTLQDMSNQSEGITAFLADMETYYADSTIEQAEETAFATYQFYFFVLILLPLTSSSLASATYDAFLNAVTTADAAQTLLQARGYQKNLFDEAKGLVKAVNRYENDTN